MPHTLVPSTIDGHINIARDLAPKYWKGVSDLTVRNYLTYYMLRKYGSLTFNATSHTQVWNARVKEPQIVPAVENQPVEFVNWDTDIQYSIGIRGYRGTDYYGERDYLISRGAPEQITDRYARKSTEMAQAMQERLCRSFWLDGNLAANANEFVGVKTCLAHDGATVVAADKIALPNGTYAGQSCALGNLGGTWSANISGTKPNASLARDFPFGQGSSEYDGTSPLIVNYGSTQFSGTATWKANAVQAASFAATALNHRAGYSNGGGAPGMCCMASEMFVDLKESFRANNRQVMPFTDGDLGYPGETLMVDGTVFSTDYSIPAGEAYMLAPQFLEAFFVHGDLFGAMGPEYSIPHVGYLYYASSYGNYKFLPKYLVRFMLKT